MPTQYSFPDAPKRCTMWYMSNTVTVGNPQVVFAQPSQIYNFYGFVSPTAANGDAFTQRVWLRDGTYTFYVLGQTGANLGRLDWYLDNAVFITAQDWYASPGVSNVVKTGPITISNGLLYHTLKAVINGKNASSSDFYTILAKFWFKQVAD